MERRSPCPDFFDKFTVVINIMVGMDTSCYVYLRNICIIKAFYFFKDLIMTEIPALRITFRLMILTEPAIVDAIVSRLNMKIPVIKNGISIDPSTN